MTESDCLRGCTAGAERSPSRGRWRFPRACIGVTATRCLRVLTLVLLACAASANSHGQATAREYRIGWLSNAVPEVDKGFIDSTRQALRDLGYSEGRNLVIDFRHSDGQTARLPALAVELVALKPDLIIAGASPGTQAVQKATTTIPIVMIGVADPVGSGFVANLARPGGNITGIANMGVDMAAKPIELLREVLPKAQRLFMLTSDNPACARRRPRSARRVSCAGADAADDVRGRARRVGEGRRDHEGGTGAGCRHHRGHAADHAARDDRPAPSRRRTSLCNHLLRARRRRQC